MLNFNYYSGETHPDILQVFPVRCCVLF